MSPSRTAPSILIAADSEPLAVGAARYIDEGFGVVRVSTRRERVASDFDCFRPAVLLLAFDQLAHAQNYLERLHRTSGVAHALPHRIILLCSGDDLQRAFECCKAGIFDDYVLFWPQTADTARLMMAIHGALHALEDTCSLALTSRQIVARARDITRLEPDLAALASRFARQVEVTQTSADAAAQRLPHLVFRQSFDEVEASVHDLCEAARTLAGALGPQLRAARTICQLSRQMRPLVLTVDNDAYQRIRLTRFLKGTNVELICASTGAQALRAIWTKRPDLVLMDIDLPDVDGVEVTRRLKAVEPLASTPVIIATARSHRTVVMESLKAGAADIMVKPYCRATLLDKLDTFLPVSVT